MKHALRRTAQALLTITLLASLVVFMGAPSLLLSLALLGTVILSGLGLKKLNTFN